MPPRENNDCARSFIWNLLSAKIYRPVRLNLNLPMQFVEPEALAEPRRRKSSSASGSLSSQLISIVQVEIYCSSKVLLEKRRVLGLE